MNGKKGEGRYNVVVIGGGTAGLVTAAGTAALGGRVALVERERMGGDCLNTGCVPSKAILSSARLVGAIARAPQWGLDPQEPQFHFEKVLERMRERRARIAPNDSRERFERLGVDVFAGHARFVSPREVNVEGTRLLARNFVIAAGSRPAVPPVEGIEDLPYDTNETIFDRLREKPARMLVVGGGPIGCEMGQAFARLGVKVTLIERLPRILEREDSAAAGVIRRQLEADGVQVLTGASVKRASRQSGLFHLDVERQGGAPLTLEAEAVLVAAGRVPRTTGLGLEEAGVAYSRTGVTVNKYLQTTQPHIYAAGDIAGPYQFTHMADYQARIVVRNILLPWLKAKVNYSVVPWATFTSPELARVGLNEDEAKKSGVAYDLWEEPIEDLDRAIVESEELGFIRVLTEKGRDKILGVTIVAEHAGDLIAEFVVAMKEGIGLSKIGNAIHPYPTFGEIARKVADRRQRARLTPAVARFFAALYRRRRR